MIKVPLLRHQRYIRPSLLTPRVETNDKKNVDFDTFDGHVMVNFIEPNFQDIIFGPIRVGLITQKQFWDHLKNCHSWILRLADWLADDSVRVTRTSSLLLVPSSCWYTSCHYSLLHTGLYLYCTSRLLELLDCM